MPPARYCKVYDIDIESVGAHLHHDDNDIPRPAAATSGELQTPQRPTNLPKFPNNRALVFEEENTNLLSELLPVLKKYQCLQFHANKTRRSPWVRAFCDLYHPAGPWGSNKFKNAPDITSQRKYSFKSYQIPTLYKHLQTYAGDSNVHLELKQALEEYFEKELWQARFLEGCQLVAATEVNKPMAERAEIPTVQNGVVVTNNNNEAAREEDESEEQEQDDEATAITWRTRAQKRQATVLEDEQEEEVPPKKRTSPRTAASPGKNNSTASAAASPPKQQATVSRAAVSPEAEKHQTKESLEMKRTELEQFLSRRQKSMAKDRQIKDPICEKIQVEIDKVDEELLKLILG